ncbi:MAG: hypothetical protein NTX87_18970 [Planctomycetota bacterium]|nr:hypothetical protein [Planctomycetota bacterium]
MHGTAVAVTLLAAMGLAGCTLRSMDLPPDFVSVDKAYLGPYAVRAVAADGVMVALRVEPNPERGTLVFWTEAITNQMAGQGYKAVQCEEVTAATGEAGRLLIFSAQKQGVTFSYILAVFVKGNDILIAEAGGKAATVEPKLAEIKKALLTAK